MWLFNPIWFKEFRGVLVYEAWPNSRDDFFNGKFAKVFIEQAMSNGIVLKNNTKCIINCCNEGLGHAEVSAMIGSLESAGIVMDFRVLYNSVIRNDLPYQYRCFVDNFSSHCGFVSHVKRLDVRWEELNIHNKFIALMRRGSVSRATIAKNLLDTYTKDTFLMSCGSMVSENMSFPELSDILEPYDFPILIDGVVNTIDEQHYHVDLNFFKCYVNVVVESSSQTDVDTWNEIFITEKSLKPFAYRQIPLWFAVPGTVNEVRKLGFDVFDDIIDHSYDDESNASKRMNMSLCALSNLFDNYSMCDLGILRKQLWSRINNNVELLYKLDNTHAQVMTKHMLELSQ